MGKKQRSVETLPWTTEAIYHILENEESIIQRGTFFIFCSIIESMPKQQIIKQFAVNDVVLFFSRFFRNFYYIKENKKILI